MLRVNTVCLLYAAFIIIVVVYFNSSREGKREVSSVNINNNKIVPNGNKTFGSITILVVLVSLYHARHYKHALDSVDCYARIQNYNYRLVADTDYRTECPHRDKFFRRHCVVALLLNQSDYTLFLDADMGIVNPNRRIEEFIDPQFEITFYDRFYNQEIMAGSYIVRNSDWSRDFLNGFANYEQRLPNSFHGTDNGALHAYIAETLFPNSRKEYEICLNVYNSSANFDDLFSYIACIRHFLGAAEDFGRIRIMKKGTAWARDCWLTNSKWNPNIDFMIHGWKLNQLKIYEKEELPITWDDFYYDWTLIEHSRSEWYNPLAEPIQLEKCMPGNTTWSYDNNLIADKRSIEGKLAKFRYEVEVKRYYYLGRIPEILQP